MSQPKSDPKAQSKYDPFFSRSMEHPLIAQAFFGRHLPPHLQQPTDLDTLIRFDRANTNVQLEQRRRDIAYKAQIQGDTSLLICAEHQSEEDITMPVRFLSYNAGDLYGYIKKHKKLPVLVNFLFYHGSQAPYPHHDTLQAYYDHPSWGSQELTLRFHVIDATQISDAEFLTHGPCAPMCLLLKHGRKGNFELEPDAYRQAFQECVKAVGDEYIYTMLTYAAELSNLVVGEKIFHFIEEVLINKRKLIMTYAQKIEQRGRHEERLVLARTMLQAQEPEEKVSKFTGLTLQQIEKLIKEIRETLTK